MLYSPNILLTYPFFPFFRFSRLLLLPLHKTPYEIDHEVYRYHSRSREHLRMRRLLHTKSKYSSKPRNKVCCFAEQVPHCRVVDDDGRSVLLNHRIAYRKRLSYSRSSRSSRLGRKDYQVEEIARVLDDCTIMTVTIVRSKNECTEIMHSSGSLRCILLLSHFYRLRPLQGHQVLV